MANLGLADDGFGAQLRRRREAAGLSLRALAQKVHYSKGHLSKVETGKKRPTTAMARICDAELGAEGELAKLVREVPRQSGLRQPVRPALDLAFLPVSAIQIGEGFVQSGRDLLRSLRAFGQTAPPVAVLPMASTAAMIMRDMAVNGDPEQQAEALVLASRFAEYAGWMAQEAGDDDTAMRWTDAAVTLATRAGDQVIAAYAMVRRGLIALYRRDAADTIRFAQQAQKMTDDPRVCGLAAQREAQGHALAGDSVRCWEALERATVLLSAAAKLAPNDMPIIGPSYVPDPAAMVRGWCQHDLGESRNAVQTLSTELARVPELARRSRSLIGARLALSLATVGEVDEACAVAEPIVRAQWAIDSATIRTDLRRLNTALARWRRHPAVRLISPDLAMAANRGDRGGLPPSYRPEIPLL